MTLFPLFFSIVLIKRAIQWFFGFQQYDWFAPTGKGEVFYYKIDLYGNRESMRWKRNKIAPWEVILPTTIILSFLLSPGSFLFFLKGVLRFFIVMLGIVLFVIVLKTIVWLGDWFDNDNNIVWRYIRAKKEKNCPLIEVVDE